MSVGQRKQAIWLGAFGALTLCLCPAAHADPRPTLGVAMGLSSGVAAESEHGGDVEGSELHVDMGIKLSPRLSLMLEGSGINTLYVTDGAHAVHTMELGMIQVTPVSGLWVRGGLGYAQLAGRDSSERMEFMAPERHSGMAYAGAVGVTLWKEPNYSMGLEVRVAHADYSDAEISTGSLLFGIRSE